MGGGTRWGRGKRGGYLFNIIVQAYVQQKSMSLRDQVLFNAILYCIPSRHILASFITFFGFPVDRVATKLCSLLSGFLPLHFAKNFTNCVSRIIWENFTMKLSYSTAHGK